MSRSIKILAGLVGTLLMVVFVAGLSQSISTGFAGFWGGFPFMCIMLFVVALALYDFWDECIRKKD